MEEQTPDKVPEHSFSGLYKHVKISVRTLDMVIIAGIIVIIALIIFGVANNGYTITFDSRGGSDVAALTDMKYADLIPEPEPPTREGYTFAGWFSDENCIYKWDFASMQISESMTLYAQWEAVSE